MFWGGEEMSLVSGMPSCLTLPPQASNDQRSRGKDTQLIETSMRLEMDARQRRTLCVVPYIDYPASDRPKTTFIPIRCAHLFKERTTAT